MGEPLRALPYYGGKSPRASNGLGRWIASLLPRRPVYVEPFGGMAGVLLSRRPVGSEVLNDADERIVDWWRAVRDRPAEFGRLIQHTPRSRVLFAEASAVVERWEEPDLLRRALAVHIVLLQGIMHGLGNVQYASISRGQFLEAADIDQLAVRLRRVQLDAVDACVLMRRAAAREDAVVYLDPPYAASNTGGYARVAYDVPSMTELMLGARSFVAVSGVSDEWDGLGWQRHEMPAVTYTSAARGAERRIEVLWTNEPVNEPQPVLPGVEP